MPAVAFSDNGNMMAAFQFVETAANHNSQIDQKIEALQKEDEVDKEEVEKLSSKKILPIVGCESTYVTIETINLTRITVIKFHF